MTFEELFAERTPLYEKYADIVVDESDRRTRDVAEELERLLR